MAVTNTNLLSGAFLLVDTVAANAAVAVKASAATLYEIEIDNTANAAVSFLKIFNVAGGSVVVGTTAPDWIISCPLSVSRPIVMPAGIAFVTALSYFCVTAGGTAGATSPSSSVIVRMVYV